MYKVDDSAKPRGISNPPGLPYNTIPLQGVGITYSSAIEPLLEIHSDLFDVVEVEPQTMWLETNDIAAPYRISEGMLEHIAQLPGRKLVHSVGAPVGGTVRPDPIQLQLLRHTVERLGSPYFSEHLSFNATTEFRTGFFLPPRQTASSIQAVRRAIGDIQEALPVPIAVETGVNYLRPRPDEMPDGAFAAAVVESADCGLLLDLHNIFANGLNGRQPVREFLDQLPLERVWEIHIAGGFELDGFWLDAHSGAIPDPLYELAQQVVPHLPNLKAIIFEIFPSFIPVFGLDGIRAEIEKLHNLWALRKPAETTGRTSNNRPDWTPIVLSDGISAETWEHALGELVIGRPASNPIARTLSEDPGVRLVNKLIGEFRGSMIVSLLRLTARLLMLALGLDVFRAILEDFWLKTPPKQFASSEAEAFGDYLNALDLKVPQLAKILEFERAVLATLMDDKPRIVAFAFDPLPLLRALAEGRLPEIAGRAGSFEIEVTPGGPISVSGLEPASIRQIFPFH